MSEPDSANNWSPEQYKFQAWLALPRRLRKPKTQKELADELGVHETTLSDWKRKTGFMAAVRVLAKDWAEDDLPEVLDALVKHAKKGSSNHIAMFLKMSGLLVEKVDVTTGGDKLVAPQQTFLPPRKTDAEINE